MIKGKRILAVVPARGGSKGIKLKNLSKIGEKSLIEMVGDVISKINGIDKAVVSTDHPGIAKEAKLFGLEVPFMRPEELSGDFISDVDVLTHALETIEQLENKHYDIVLMLQPTSPLRKPEHVEKTIQKLITFGYDSVLTVSETDSKGHPFKQLLLKNDQVEYYDEEGKKIIARQQLKPVYHRNGVAYAITKDCLLNQKTTIGKNASAVIIEDTIVNIDTEWDLMLAQWLNSNF